MSRKADEGRRTPPALRFAPLGEVRTFEISEAESEQVENSPPVAIDLTVATALLPSALTVLVTVKTVPFPAGSNLPSLFWIAFWLLLVQGLYALGRWWPNRHSMRALTKKIRDRMPEKLGIPEQWLTHP